MPCIATRFYTTHTGITGNDLNNSTGTTAPLISWLDGSAHDPLNNTMPKAFINWVFMDEQFNTITGSMTGCDAVSANNNVLKNHHQTISITRNGYLYVYCSNESDLDVFFDNLQLIQTHGPLIEETHYYPFGLTMSGISSKALNFGEPENNKLYNKGSELQHHEFSDGSGLELYSTNFRSLDPQLGRWWQIDPEIEDGQFSESSYESMDNNPILKNDPKGDEACCSFTAAWNTIKTTQKVAGVVELAGGGPEDPVADAIAGVVEIGGFIKAGWDFFAKDDKPVVKVNTDAPPPNNGEAKKHGSNTHNDAIDKRIKELKNDKEVSKIRKNQQQVDVNENKVGKNRPDIQYDKKGEHHNEEIDHSQKRSDQHAATIKKNDPNSIVKQTILKKKPND